MSLGPTHYSWRGDVGGIVRAIRNRWPHVTVNTYVGHPWAGWDGRSFDVWGPGGRGHALDRATGFAIRRWLMGLPGAPFIRHTIYENTLWTSFGGYSLWAPEDHDGWLQHLHVTYW